MTKFFLMHFTEIFSSCNDVFRSGLTTNGIYKIAVQGIDAFVPVYCELEIGW